MHDICADLGLLTLGPWLILCAPELFLCDDSESFKSKQEKNNKN